jgi:hypothetical protein
VNGLGFEGWLDRLGKASATKAPIIVASKGIKPLERAGAHDRDHEHGSADPHAWQSVANVKIYVSNIRDALIAADPAGKRDYEMNAGSYLARLDALEREVRDTLAKIPPTGAGSSPATMPSVISRQPMASISLRRRASRRNPRHRPRTSQPSSAQSGKRRFRPCFSKM